jgi:hypothetical protein
MAVVGVRRHVLGHSHPRLVGSCSRSASEGVGEGVGDQLGDVGVGDAVVEVLALPPAGHQTLLPQDAQAR